VPARLAFEREAAGKPLDVDLLIIDDSIGQGDARPLLPVLTPGLAARWAATGRPRRVEVRAGAVRQQRRGLAGRGRRAPGDERNPRRGIGTAVLDLVVERFRRRGAPTLTTSVHEGDGCPMAFHERWGSARTGEVDDGRPAAPAALIGGVDPPLGRARSGEWDLRAPQVLTRRPGAAERGGTDR
jgi:hypothetical protein